MCVTLNEGYLRAASRGIRNLYRFLIKIYITYQPSMKRRIFLVCHFYSFFETADLRSYCGYFLAICQLCFYDLKRTIGDVLIYSLLFERILNQEMKRMKIIGVVWVLKKIEVWSEKSGFLFVSLFPREREFEV